MDLKLPLPFGAPPPGHGRLPPLASPASSVGPAHPVTATIGTLTLRGFPPLNTAQVQAEFTAEFARLARNKASAWVGSSPPRATDLSHLKLTIAGTCDPRTLGRQLAHAIADYLKPTPVNEK